MPSLPDLFPSLSACRTGLDRPKRVRSYSGWLLGSAFLLLAGVGIFLAYHYWADQRKARRLVEHTHQVIEAIYGVYAALADMEAGQRGYLLTLDRSYLEPYYGKRQILSSDIDRLIKLVVDNPDQSRRAVNLARLAMARSENLAKGLILIRIRGQEAALQEMRTKYGKNTMQSFREDARAMAVTERELLDRRQDYLRETEQRSLALAALFASLSVAGFGAAFQTLARERRADRDELFVRTQAEAAARRTARQERELRELEERFRVAQDLSPDGFAILIAKRDAGNAIVDFVFSYINSAALRFIGRSERQLEGALLLEVLPGLTPPNQIFASFARVVETGEPFTSELRYNADGISDWFRVMTIKLRDGIAVSLRNITARKDAEERLKALLAQRELLLQEMNHRVRNNLQIVGSLLNLQARKIKDEAAQQAFADAYGRIVAVANVQRHLDHTNVGKVEFAKYLQGLADQLLKGFGLDDRVVIEVDAEPGAVDLDQAVPLCLIVNELVTNALKYAFGPADRGRIAIRYGRNADGTYFLSVSDDGRGLPAKPDSPESGLGLGLVESFARQVGGTVAIESANGLTVTVTF